MIYKIRNKVTGQWSNGRVARVHGREVAWDVKFNQHGKEWADEATLKKHILTVLTKMKWDPRWEIIEVHYIETKPAIDWVDPDMLLKIMKQ